MQTRDLPRQYVIQDHAGTRILPLVAFFPMVITLAVFLGVTLTNREASLDEWHVPLLGIGMMSLTVFTFGIVLELAIKWWNIRQIKQVYRDPWAIWIPYENDEKWQTFIENDHQKAMKTVSFSFVPIVIVGVVVTVIGGAMVANGIEVYVLFGLAGFLAIVVAIFVGEWLYAKWQIHARYKRRKKSPPPAILISEYGHYDEDQGYNSLRGLEKIEFKRSGKRGRAKVNFGIKAQWYQRLFEPEYYGYQERWVIGVDVPKHYEADAEALVTRFQIEVLV